MMRQILLEQFLPFPATYLRTMADIESAPQLAVRATVFPACGGVVVGICSLHKIIDAHTLIEFMNLWGAIARDDGGGGGHGVGGGAWAHDRAGRMLFPARGGGVEMIPLSSVDFGCEEGEKRVTRRFVFDGEAILRLKARARSDRVPKPSRSEVVAGFIWESAVNATAKALWSKGGDEGKAITVHSVAGTAVNLRSRMKEIWPDYSVGNIFWLTPMVYDSNHQSYSWNERNTLKNLVSKLRSATAKVDGEFMERVEGGEGRGEFLRNQEAWYRALTAGASSPDDQSESKVVIMVLGISSVVGIRFYDVDFGWGKPVWVSMARFADRAQNTITLMQSPSPTGWGLETWVTLLEPTMSILEHDPEFLAYASNNPSVMI